MLDYAVSLMRNPAHEDDPAKAYAFLQSRAVLSIDEIADHMVTHGCPYDRGDIIAVIAKLVSCTKELMLDGYRIQLGDLGRLSLSCRSVGAVSLEAFTRANIREVRVNFKPSSQFSGMANNVSMHRVPTRKAVAAALAAETAGLTAADWSADDSTDSTGSDDTEP